MGRLVLGIVIKAGSLSYVQGSWDRELLYTTITASRINFVYGFRKRGMLSSNITLGCSSVDLESNMLCFVIVLNEHFFIICSFKWTSLKSFRPQTLVSD